jgi:hypothetical protein
MLTTCRVQVARTLARDEECRVVTKVETRIDDYATTLVANGGTIRKLPVSRKARHAHVVRLELVALLVLVGVLATVMFSAIGGASRVAIVAACDANAKVVNEGVAAMRAIDSSNQPTTPSAWMRALLPGSTAPGGPFLRSWPASRQYAISVAGVFAPVDSGDLVAPRSGDVLVTVASTHKIFDATAHPGVGCATA